jgi:hypothetical protein
MRIKNQRIQQLFANFEDFYVFQFLFPQLYQQLIILEIKGAQIDIGEENELLEILLNRRFFYLFHEIIRMIGKTFYLYHLHNFFQTDITAHFEILLNQKNHENKTDIHQSVITQCFT